MSYITELIKKGRIVASWEAEQNIVEEEGNEELSDAEQKLQDEGAEVSDEPKEESPFLDEEETTEEDTSNEDTEEEPEEPVEETKEKEEKPVKKVYTLEVLAKVMAVFDQYYNELGIDWNSYVVKGKLKKCPSFVYLEDMRTLINNTLDEKKFMFVETYNKLYDYLTDDSNSALLALYGREKYGKPFIVEGLTLLLYELSIDWAIFMTRYYKEMPELENEEDSFFKKFPNLRLLTYLAHLLINSKEFHDLVSKDNIRELLDVEDSYKLSNDNVSRSKRKEIYKLAGENFSYYASLVRFNYGDIMVGVLDKLGTLAFLTWKGNIEMMNKLQLITMLIRAISNKNPVNIQNNSTDKQLITSSLDPVDAKATEILKSRSEAKILLDANEKQYPLAEIE